MTFSTEDTIVAIATPPGTGGVAIVRLSGPDSLAIARRLFRRPATAQRTLTPRVLHYGHCIEPESGALLDEGLLAWMRAPQSYTGEDVVEINTHGSPLVVRRIVEAALRLGARAAEPGEMTLRAFLHGRLDLAQAESVADLIAATSDAALRQALGQLAGHLSERVHAARLEVLRALTPIDATIDFPEEEVPAPDRADLRAAIQAARATVAELLAGAERGRVAREGIRCVIVGRPNVGKSSLLNALLRADRAIVTPVAGTTRDTIEEAAIVGGVACHLIDTAGIAPTDDPIERIGVARSRAALDAAELALLVLDRAAPLSAEDRAIMAEIAARQSPSPASASALRCLVIANKADLPLALADQDLAAALDAAHLELAAPLVVTSLATGAGLGDLEAIIAQVALGGPDTGSAPLVARARHRDALRRADAALTEAEHTLADGYPLDLAAEDLRDALHALGTITGESITEDLLTSIFSEFCIGK